MLIRAAAAALLLACLPALAAASAERTRAERGVVSRVAGVWQIVPCGSDRSPLAIGDATDGDLQRAHRSLATDQATGVYMELLVEPGTDERGPRARSVRRAASEASGCAETWTGERLRARGTSPAWSLVLRQASVELQHGGRTVAAPAPESRRAGATRVYETRADGTPLLVRVSERRCIDRTSSERFPLSVEVQIGETVLKGCGTEPAGRQGTR